MSDLKKRTRDALVAAAELELVRGQGQLEMQALAARAKVSIGLAYHHFGSKAGLVAAVVEAFYLRLELAVFRHAGVTGASWATRERARIGDYIRFHYGDPLAPLVIGALIRAPEVQDIERAFTERQLKDGARMIAAAQRDGIVGATVDSHVIIALMSGGIRQALIGALLAENRPDADRLTEEIWSFMADALRLSAKADRPIPVPT